MERTPDQVAFVSGQEELRLILAHPFTAWRTFLHPSQREIAYRPTYSGPAQAPRVLTRRPLPDPSLPCNRPGSSH